jgi:hypothetical protein
MSRRLVNWRYRALQNDAVDPTRQRFPCGIDLAVTTLARSK